MRAIIFGRYKYISPVNSTRSVLGAPISVHVGVVEIRGDLSRHPRHTAKGDCAATDRFIMFVQAVLAH